MTDRAREALRDLAEAARNACDARKHPALTEALAEADAALLDEPCDHYKMVSGGNGGPWTCAKCGAVDPPRPKWERRAVDEPTEAMFARMGEAAEGAMLSEMGWADIGRAAWRAAQGERE